MQSAGVKFSGPGTVGLVGRLFITGFFLVFLLAGLFFTVVLLREVFRAAETYAWKEVPCEIVSSAVAERRTSSGSSTPYWFEVRYAYSIDGNSFSSSRHRRSAGGFGDYNKAQRLALRYPPESKQVCYVDPSNPAEAVLERQSLWLALVIPFPLVFVGIGAGGIFFTWRKRSGAAAPAERQSISSRATAATGTKFLLILFSLLLLVGAGTFYGFFVRPVGKVLDARDWVATPCVVVSSQVRRHDSDDGTTYSVDILYAYSVNGKEYKSNRYRFMSGSSGGYRGKADLVNRHPPGTRMTCYVNPRDPTDAVLERGFTAHFLFGLIPGVFILVGGGGIVFVLRAGGRAATASPAQRWQPKELRAPLLRRRMAVTAPAAVSPSGPVVLKPAASPWAKLVGAIVVAAFWNGILSVFVYQVFESWRGGRTEWFLTIFLVPFLLVGLAMLGACGYFFLALFNPRPVLRVSSNAVPLGETLELQWRLIGRVEALGRLRLYLEGREEATYRRGTSTCTDKEVFATVELADINAHPEKRAGGCRAVIPASNMHSFESGNNRIVWTLHVRGDIRWWPDVKEEFPIVILPAPPSRPSSL
jgi:hypothetical protein